MARECNAYEGRPRKSRRRGFASSAWPGTVLHVLRKFNKHHDRSRRCIRILVPGLKTGTACERDDFEFLEGRLGHVAARGIVKVRVDGVLDPDARPLRSRRQTLRVWVARAHGWRKDEIRCGYRETRCSVARAGRVARANPCSRRSRRSSASSHRWVRALRRMNVPLTAPQIHFGQLQRRQSLSLAFLQSG